ncbi:hypothetical protein EVA_08311, partial [gut metagenome]
PQLTLMKILQALLKFSAADKESKLSA